jgi:hypothetical protein
MSLNAGGVTALCHDAGSGREMALAFRSSLFFAHGLFPKMAF